jgi:hypothetical protein
MSNPVQFRGPVIDRRCILKLELTLYILDVVGILIKESNLVTLYDIFKTIVKQRNLLAFDNPSIVICDNIMEKLFNQRSMHIEELKHNIIKKVDLQPVGPVVRATVAIKSLTDRMLSAPQNPSTSQTAPMTPTHTAAPPSNQMYRMKPSLARLLTGRYTRAAYTFAEVASMMSTYILTRRQVFLDPRNIMVCHVEGDRLEQVLGISCFHRSQICSLLRNKLVPIEDDRRSTTPT